MEKDLERILTSLRYWEGISECSCESDLPQGGCLKCDLEEAINTISEDSHNRLSESYHKPRKQP